MILPKPRLIIRVVVFCLALLSSQFVHSQCNPPNELPTITCEEAPLVCLLNACYETLNNPLNCCNGWCGANTAIHNPEYFAFIPTCPDVEIYIHVDFCTSGVGLQSALLQNCPWDNSDVIACDPGTPPGGTMMLSATGLIVGQQYWLVIDGSSGATCDYTITHTECVQEFGFNGESLTSGEAIPSVACQGFNNLTLSAEPEILGAHGYWWFLEWDNDTVESTLPVTTIDIPEDLDPGIYEICVLAFSGCDTSDMEFCFEVEVYEIPAEEKDPFIECEENFPIFWGPMQIPGPGDYEQSFFDADGCRYDSTWTVEAYPVADVGEIDTVHCLPLGENTFYYEGDPYDESGTTELFYDDADVNGCDSFANLNLTLIGIDAFVELSCQNGEFYLNVQVQDVIPNGGDLEYFWYEGGGGALVFDNEPFITTIDGCYDLWIRVTDNAANASCDFFIETFCFDGDDYYPPAPVMAEPMPLICQQEGVEFCVVEDPFGPPILEYVWSGPFNVPIDQDGSNCATFDWSVAGPGEVCVTAFGECGPSEPTCFNVEIIATPVATFTYTPDVCINEANIITFTGSASPNATILWDFGNPSSVVGTGIGPYTVSWALEGNKSITLTVIEPGCDTAFNSAIVTVANLETPVINCTSTINSIFFNWADIAGATGYTIQLNGGAPTNLSVSEHLEAPLSPGTNVTMILTAISGGPCPSTMDTMTCVAEDCPAPTIVLSGQDSACLNNATIIDLDAQVNGSPGTGSWSGPGITDPAAGLFDPKVAGPGQHPLIYTVDVNGCPFNDQFQITVFDSLTADFTLDPSICISDVANLIYTGNAALDPNNFDYDFGPANVVAGSGPGPYQLDWTTPGTKTVRLQVNQNGCSSDIISRTTQVSPQLNPIAWNCSPNTSGVVFTWTADATSPDQDTIILKGGTPTVNGNDLEFTGMVPGDTVRIAVITYSAGPCPDRIDTVFCVAKDCPSPGITVDPVADICLYPGTGIVNLNVTVVGGNGVGDWSGPGVIDVVNGRFDPNVAGPGSHLVTYHYEEDGCDFNNSITINVSDPPQAFISNTDLMITCQASSLFLDGTGSSGNGLTYLWTTGNGLIIPPVNQPTAEVSAAGVYQLLVTNAAGCKDSSRVTVTVDASIPVPVAGVDRIITCDSTQFVLGGASTTGPNIVYSWSTTNGNIVGPINGITAIADAVGDYILNVRDTVTGCDADDLVIVGIDTVTATITLTPGDTIDCNTPISTATSSLNEPANDYTYSWSTIDGNFSGPTTGPNVDVQQGGTYTLTIHNLRNGCETSADVVIEESDEIIDAVDVTQKNVKCFGEDNGSLVINSVTGGIPPYNYAWNVSPTGGDSLSQLGPGVYILTVSDNNGCSFVETYTIVEPPLVTLEIGPNLTVAAMDSVRIDLATNLAPNEVGSIAWSGFDGLSCDGCPSLQFIASTSGVITAIITDTSGCVATDSMKLTVIVPRIIFIPNVFSPNGDEINDYFTISGRFNLINIAELTIYDRWGNELFNKVNMTPGIEEQGWDGTFNGEPMQPGVYVFVAKLDYEDISETVSGNITIVR